MIVFLKQNVNFLLTGTVTIQLACLYVTQIHILYSRSLSTIWYLLILIQITYHFQIVPIINFHEYIVIRPL